jgi:Zn-dependent peptidase ImmA (M78 family)
MSIAAIIFRLHSLNIITDNQKLYLNMQLSKKGYRTQEPLDDEIKHEETFLLQEVCRELELNNIVNIDDYLYANNMRDILNIPKIEKQKVIPRFEIKNVENKYVN